MGFTTVFVHVPDKLAPYELHRDARDPEGNAEIERMCRLYSERPPRLVRVYLCGMHVPSWRTQRAPVYEARNGQATKGFA